MSLPKDGGLKAKKPAKTDNASRIKVAAPVPPLAAAVPPKKK